MITGKVFAGIFQVRNVLSSGKLISTPDPNGFVTGSENGFLIPTSNPTVPVVESAGTYLELIGKTPLPGVSVYLSYQDGKPISPAISTISDANGNYKLEFMTLLGVAPPPYGWISFAASGYKTVTIGLYSANNLGSEVILKPIATGAVVDPIAETKTASMNWLLWLGLAGAALWMLTKKR
jgi:hypothetical protein